MGILAASGVIGWRLRRSIVFGALTSLRGGVKTAERAWGSLFLAISNSCPGYSEMCFDGFFDGKTKNKKNEGVR